MLKIQTAIKEKPHLFDDMAGQWRHVTGGVLILLSPRGEVIKGRNGAPGPVNALIQVSDSGELQVAPHARAIITPLVVQGEVQGHLLSENSTPDQLPALAWAAETFLGNLDNEQTFQDMTDELIAAWDQLDLVYRITQTLAQQSNLSDALNSILQEIINVVKVTAGFVLLRYNDTFDCISAGSQQLVDLICQKTFVDKLITLKRLVLFNTQQELLEFWPQAPPELNNFLGTFIATSGQSVATLGLINNRQRPFTAGDVKLITAVAEQLGAIIDNYRLHQELVAQERVRRELEIAAEIQESLLPKSIPHVTGLAIDVNSLPAHEVGGDFYDFISPDDTHLTIVIGDVAGKGVPAAMFTSMVRTMLKIEAFHSQEPHIIIKRVNDVLHQDLWQAELFVTAFIATFDTKNNVLMYANAGHAPGIIYHAQSQTSRLLKATSLPLGISGYDYKITQYVHLAPGDTLILYSDGISEALNANGRIYGFQRIQHLVHRHADKSPNILKQIILRDLADFQQTAPPTDDITLVVVKFSQEEVTPKPRKAWTVLETLPFKYKADTVHLTDISRKVTAACRVLNNLPADSKGDDFVYLVELAVSEICTNTIEHAYAEQEGFITGQITLTNVGIQIDIYDQGYGFNPNTIPPPMSDPMDPSEGGYGLHIVRQIMDIAEYQANTPQGNHWRLVKYLPS
ncbi:MAG: SpoIIE family protein phosphatase [Anaerolineae bacterium]